MVNSTTAFTTLQDITGEVNLRKVVVIGSGGVGKMRLVNILTNKNFQTSETNADGTLDFQGALLPRNPKILVVDSPGYRLNEDRWLRAMLEISNVIGIIIMHTHERRNSNYGRFGHVLNYLKDKDTKVKKFLMDHSATVDSENYMCGSTSASTFDLQKICSDLQGWFSSLNDEPIQIWSPIDLLEQYDKRLDENRDLKQEIARLNIEHARETSEHFRNIGSLEGEIKGFEKLLDELPEQLATYDEDSKSFSPDAPPWPHYLYSWLPFAGIHHLSSLRDRAAKDLKIAKKLRNMKKKH